MIFQSTLRLSAIATTLTLLAGCFIPAEFDASGVLEESELRTEFSGAFAHTELLKHVKRGGEVEDEAIATVMGQMKQGLEQAGATIENLSYDADAHLFRIDYSTTNDLSRRMRNSPVAGGLLQATTVTSPDEGLGIRIQSPPISSRDYEAAAEMGVMIKGEVCLDTDKPLAEQNAATVSEPGLISSGYTYCWTLSQETPAQIEFIYALPDA